MINGSPDKILPNQVFVGLINTQWAKLINGIRERSNVDDIVAEIEDTY